MKPSKASLTPRAKLASPNIGVLVVEKGIPLTKRANSKRVFPFDRMEIGDSFFLAGDSLKCQQKLSGALQNFPRANGEVFVTRQVEGGARVWRVAPPVDA